VDSKEPDTVKPPEINTLPGIVIEPDESIVRPATPLATSAICPMPGLMIPVLALLANFKAQLDKEPGERLEFTQSARNNGYPPIVDAS
jgi:hypothetical protein